MRSILDLKYNFSLGADNGNVISITNNRDTTRTQNFTYDQVNRIVTAETASTYPTSPGNCWGESFGYDQWANLLSIGVASSSYNGCLQENLSVSASAYNQIIASGFSYDASGNVLADGKDSYAWNAESEIKSATGVNYTYDGDGNRVQKSNGKVYWYGAGTEILDESDASGNITDEYVFFGGKRVARQSVSSGTIYYYAEDFLGSSRVIATSAGAVCYDADFYPYGGELVFTNTCAQNYKFTGKERDSETGNDNFGARYNSSAYGRFLSPDPKLAITHILDPQTLNRYAYARDNPVLYVDPDGRDLAKAWEDVKTFASTFSMKVSIGVGAAIGGHLGPIEYKAAAVYKGSAETSGDAKLKVTRSVEVGVAAGLPAAPKQGESVEAAIPVITVHNDNSVEIGGHTEATVTNSLGNDVTLNTSGDKISIGAELGVLLVGGADVGTTKQGLAALKDAAKEVKDSVTVPPPPITSIPPPPPPTEKPPCYVKSPAC